MTRRSRLVHSSYSLRISPPKLSGSFSQHLAAWRDQPGSAHWCASRLSCSGHWSPPQPLPGLTFCPGSRCTRRAACRAAAGRSVPSLALIGGSGPRARGPSYLFSSGLQEKGSVPTSSSAPCSPQRAPTPTSEQETQIRPPLGACRGQALSWCSSPSKKWAGCAPFTEEEIAVQSGEGTCQRPSLGGGRARTDPSPAPLSGKSSQKRSRYPHLTSLVAQGVTNHSRDCSWGRDNPFPSPLSP